MKKFAWLAVVLLTACSTTKEKEVPAVDLAGQWYIESIVFSDDDYVRPAEEVPGSRQYVIFDDEGYFIQTNCNTVSGSYTIKGDTLTLADGPMTEMACDNMATEEALRRVLNQSAAIDVENDTITRLNFTESGAYMILRKATEKK